MTRREQIEALVTPGDATVTKMMAAYSLDAIDHASREGRTLDYSEGSLHDVEAMIAKLHNTMPGRTGMVLGRGPTDEQIATVAKMYGGYIGFVMRFEWGEGEWVVPEDGPFAKALCLQYGRDALTSPPAKVYKRVVDGPADNIWYYYQVLSQGRKEHR